MQKKSKRKYDSNKVLYRDEKVGPPFNILLIIKYQVERVRHCIYTYVPCLR